MRFLQSGQRVRSRADSHGSQLLRPIADKQKLTWGRHKLPHHGSFLVMLDTLLLLALNGLIWGLIIALIALGLSLIFGLLDIINIAHGDFWVAFLIVPLIGFIFGALIQRVVIQPIRNVAALSIVATFGLSLILQEG